MIEFLKKYPEDKELRMLQGPESGCWVNMVRPTPEEVSLISDKLQVPTEYLTYPLDDNEKPRIEKGDGCTMIIFRMPHKIVSPDGVSKEQIETVPLGIVLTQNALITVTQHSSDILNDFRSRFKNFATEHRTRFLLLILHRINNYYSYFLNMIEKEVDGIEKDLAQYVRNHEIIKFFAMKKTLMYFSNSVVANNNVLKKILGGKVVTLYEEDEDILEDIIIENDQAIEMVTLYRNILTGTLDAYASIVSNNLNLVMKTLTMITIFLAIPTMVTSFYGMNIKLPIESNPHAYLYILLTCTILTLIFVFIFKKAKWF